MSWTGAFVMFVISWLIVFVFLAPRGVVTQAEAGAVEPGTPAGAPSELNLGRKAIYATIAASVFVSALAAVIGYEILTLDDFGFLYPESYDRLRHAHD